MVASTERFFKAAIVDKNPSISSAALVSAYHLFPVSKEVIKRWVNEAQEAVNATVSRALSTLPVMGLTVENAPLEEVMSELFAESKARRQEGGV